MKLLVVDDDAKIAGALRRGLTAEGFRSRWPPDGPRACGAPARAATTSSCSTSCCRGATATGSARTSAGPATPRPILMLTAKDGDLDEAEGLDTGADDYLRKPFSFPVLVVPRARAAAPLRPGCARRRWSPATCGRPPRAPGAAGPGRRSPLTAREFDLLAFLLRRAGHVVASGRSSPASGTTSSTAIRTSSRSTSPGSAASSGSRPSARIETVRGAGYRLSRT